MSEQSRSKALNMAADILKYGQRSAAALYDRLIEKGAAEDDADYAVARLLSLGYLCDEDYASGVARDLRARGYGKARVRQALKQKKVEPEAIEQALEQFSPDGDKLQSIIKRKLAGEASPDRKILKKLTDGLFRRGFSWEEIRAALREYLDSEDVGDLED